jgi:hypothetical protein
MLFVLRPRRIRRGNGFERISLGRVLEEGGPLMWVGAVRRALLELRAEATGRAGSWQRPLRGGRQGDDLSAVMAEVHLARRQSAAVQLRLQSADDAMIPGAMFSGGGSGPGVIVGTCRPGHAEMKLLIKIQGTRRLRPVSCAWPAHATLSGAHGGAGRHCARSAARGSPAICSGPVSSLPRSVRSLLWQFSPACPGPAACVQDECHGRPDSDNVAATQASRS